MKKNFLLFSLLTIIGFTTFSCSRDDDKTTQTDNSWMYGKWNVTEAKTTENGSWTNATSLGWYAQFNADGIWTIWKYSFWA